MSLRQEPSWTEQPVPPRRSRSWAGRQRSIRWIRRSGDAAVPPATAEHRRPTWPPDWLARILDGGEDPLFVARRPVRFANEHVGTADSQVIQPALAAWHVYERLVSPEGELALARAVVGLATAAKSIGLDDVPRVGIVLSTSPGFETVQWTGDGPHETYPDHRASALTGTWTSTVDGLAVPCLRPQENGGRAHTVHARLTDDRGTHLALGFERPMQINVSHVTTEGLTDAGQVRALPRRAQTVVHFDVAHRGLGTASVGPDTPPESRVGPGSYMWTWWLDLSFPTAGMRSRNCGYEGGALAGSAPGPSSVPLPDQADGVSPQGSGRAMRKVQPRPGAVSRVMRPSWAVTRPWAMARPRPEPPVARVRESSVR